ncbi:MAG TPA: flagellar motor protein MotB, partial [Devosia sp.]|nr:flagellar motor protein MotB [Devosia sp.]
MADFDRPIIIKKVKKRKHAHHGGAWKIAYADFVTAMMAFFLLLWLISMTTDEQKKGLADYFAPTNVSLSTSGAGGIMGGTSMDDDGTERQGSAVALKQDAAAAPDSAKSGAQDASLKTESGHVGTELVDIGTSQNDLKAADDLAFQSAAASIQQAWQALPDITELADNLLVEKTDEGLNIQIVDQAGQPMFPEGSKFPFEMTRAAIAAIAPVLQQLPNRITISGHTAAGVTYANPRYGPWELSSDRANVVRSILGQFGLADDHVQSVSGQSTADPFFPNDPYMAANERIKITVL